MRSSFQTSPSRDPNVRTVCSLRECAKNTRPAESGQKTLVMNGTNTAALLVCSEHGALSILASFRFFSLPRVVLEFPQVVPIAH